MQRRETNAPDSPVGDEKVASTERILHSRRNVLWIRLFKALALITFLCGLVGAFVYAITSSRPLIEVSHFIFNL